MPFLRSPQGDLYAREADNVDDFTRQQLELQGQLQNAAQDPEKAQKIQQEQLNLMKHYQDARTQQQRRHIERRQLDLQQKFHKNANKPKKAQKIQEQQLRLMKEQQDEMIEAQKKSQQRRGIDRRAAPKQGSKSPVQQKSQPQKASGSAPFKAPAQQKPTTKQSVAEQRMNSPAPKKKPAQPAGLKKQNSASQQKTNQAPPPQKPTQPQYTPAQQELRQEVIDENKRLAMVHQKEMAELADAQAHSPGSGALSMMIVPGRNIAPGQRYRRDLADRVEMLRRWEEAIYGDN